MKESLQSLIEAFQAAQKTPENLTQIWLNVQAVKTSTGPNLVLPLANSFPEVIRSNFGLVPKKKRFAIWPFQNRR